VLGKGLEGIVHALAACRHYIVSFGRVVNLQLE